MQSRETLIERAYKMPYKDIEPYLNSEGWAFVISIQKAFPDYEISKEDNQFDNTHGYRFRPWSLRGIEKNGGWELTGYHDGSVRNCPLRNGEYYHIGFLNYNGSFSYQGIKEYDDGFFEDGYHLKPFPTHYIKIDKPANALYI